jgi:hypothetical protein
MLKTIDRAVNTYFGVRAYFRKIWFGVAVILPLFPALCRIAAAQTGTFPTLSLSADSFTGRTTPLLARLLCWILIDPSGYSSDSIESIESSSNDFYCLW